MSVAIRPRLPWVAVTATAGAIGSIAVLPLGWAVWWLAIAIRVGVVVAAAAGVAHTRPARRAPWAVLIAGVGVGTTADSLTELDRLTPLPEVWSIPTGGLHVAAYALLLAAGVLFSRARGLRADLRLPLDTAIVVAAVATLLLQFVDGPDGELTVAGLEGLWPPLLITANVAMLIIAIRLAVREPVRQQLSLLALVAGAFLGLFATLHLAITRPGVIAGAQFEVAAWLGGALLVVLAAWHPSARLLTEPQRPRAVGLLTTRHAAVSVTVFAIPATLLVSALRGQPVNAPRLAAVSLILLGLIATQTVVATRAEHSARRALTERAVCDALTGLGNRALLDDALTDLLTSARETGQSVAVYFLDLVNFKRINDSLGHSAGDDLLIDVAERLRAHVREGDVLARFGGDEFVVATPLAGSAGTDVATLLARRLLEAFHTPFVIGDHDLTVRAAIGITLATPDDDRDVAALLRDADTAMYSAKKDQHSCALFDTALRRQATRELSVETELRRAFADDEIVLFYQPVLPLRQSGTAGHEALVRWNHPERGLLGPGEFLPIVAAAGLHDLLTRRTLTLATAQLAAWSNPQDRHHMAVNLSEPQLRAPGLVQLIADLLDTHHLDPSRLIIEVTEDSLIEGSGSSAATLQALTDLGVGLAIDDFGTGYSCLAYLSRLPVTVLKVDRAFVADLGTGRRSEAVITAVVDIARAFDLTTVAEGIESTGQLDAVRALGCDAVQGFLLGRPAPPGEVAVPSRSASQR